MATSEEIAWLAGILEGEGSFYLQRDRGIYLYPRVVVSMTDEDVIQRVADLFGAKIYKVPVSPRYPARKQQWRAVATGQRAVRLMKEIRPLMGKRRGAKIDEIIAYWESQPEPNALRSEYSKSQAAGKRRDEAGRFVVGDA
ncbi:LAGLIDADG family homing endonuclease [Microlunatus parietis]|uniref:LAGLIDADG endonuclease n=1 Tax=Microlunatus parietis TaxID=682979 RepID=A0A7Y9ICJ3_9ACTN|nr:LAGLIDADG family homing endonuclease [Microlunatus parietis]NYE74426.1 hypothetical protein [Microlunatus parietis]